MTEKEAAINECLDALTDDILNLIRQVVRKRLSQIMEVIKEEIK